MSKHRTSAYVGWKRYSFMHAAICTVRNCSWEEWKYFQLCVWKYETLNNLPKDTQQRSEFYVLYNYTLLHNYTGHCTTMKHIVSSVLRNKLLLKYSQNVKCMENKKEVWASMYIPQGTVHLLGMLDSSAPKSSCSMGPHVRAFTRSLNRLMVSVWTMIWSHTVIG